MMFFIQQFLANTCSKYSTFHSHSQKNPIRTTSILIQVEEKEARNQERQERKEDKKER